MWLQVGQAPPSGSYKALDGTWILPGGRQATPRTHASEADLWSSGSALALPAPPITSISQALAQPGTPQGSGIGLTISVESPKALPRPAPVSAPSKCKPSWWKAVWKYVPTRWPGTILAVALLGGLGFWSGPVALSLAQSFLSVTGDLTKISSGGVNLTVAVSEMAIAVSRTSMGLLHESWCGVDIDYAHFKSVGSQWFMHASLIGSDFLDTQIGRQLAPLDTAEKQRLQVALESVSSALPELRVTSSSLPSNKSLLEITYHVIALPNYFVGVSIALANVSFRLRWVNPLWEKNWV